MKAPDKIYLSVEKGEDWAYAMWTQKSPEEQKFSELNEHEEYIRKDALLKWLEGKMTIEGATEGIVGGYDLALKDVIDKLNQM